MRDCGCCCSMFACALLALSSITAVGQRTPPPILRILQSIPLTGVQGGFDHFAYDPTEKRLFLAASDNGSVETIDTVHGQRLKSISGFTNPHSILFRPGSPTLLVTDSGVDASALVDPILLTKVRNLKLALGANCILFDPEKKKAYVTAGGDRVDERTSTLLAVDPDSGTVLKSVEVDALHLQPMALDVRTHRLFVNIADQSSIAIFDRDSLKRTGTWYIPRGSKNSPIVFDSEHRRLFVIASDPGIMMELNADSGQLQASVPTPPNPDDMAFDPKTERLFVPGSGEVAVFDVSTPAHIKLLQQLQTGKDARTAILFRAATRFAVAVPAEGSKQAHILIFEVR